MYMLNFRVVFRFNKAKSAVIALVTMSIFNEVETKKHLKYTIDNFAFLLKLLTYFKETFLYFPSFN